MCILCASASGGGAVTLSVGSGSFECVLTSVVLTNSTFSNNAATGSLFSDGGAGALNIAIGGTGNVGYSEVLISGCVMDNNTATGTFLVTEMLGFELLSG